MKIRSMARKVRKKMYLYVIRYQTDKNNVMFYGRKKDAIHEAKSLMNCESVGYVQVEKRKMHKIDGYFAIGDIIYHNGTFDKNISGNKITRFV